MKFIRRVTMLFRRPETDRDMTSEMQAHLDLQSEKNIRAGMNPDEARYAAQRQFGNVTAVQQLAREQRSGALLDHLQRDLRQIFRALVKTPGMSLVIILSLGIGIGMNAVIFSWMRGLVFRPLPGVADATQLLLVEPRNESGSYRGTSWKEYHDLEERLRSFQSLMAYRMMPLNFGPAARQERVHSQMVSGNYFSTLGLRPELGRFLREDEAKQPGAAPVVVISHDFWQNRFAGARDVVGREIFLNERTFTIIGVAPADFRGTMLGLSFDLWVPATMAPVLLGGSGDLEPRDVRSYSLVGTLRRGATENQARAELSAAMQDLAAAYPDSNAGIQAEILPFWRAPRGAARLLLNGLAVMQGFMLLVLLVVCANAANLLLARATARRREMGVRLALGARPRQILRLVLTESLLLGALAAGVGIILAGWGTNALRAVPLPSGFPFKFDTDLEINGLVFTILLGMGCTLLFGLAPAWQAAHTDSQLALRTARQPGTRSHLRGALVSVEVALALLVLVTAAMFMRNFLETRTTDTGFKQAGVLLGTYDLSGNSYDKRSGLELMGNLLRRLEATPGVESAAIASWVPLDFHGMPAAGFKIDGQDAAGGGLNRALSYTVTPGYFKLMAIPLVAGRDFAALNDTSQPPQVLVNEEFVRRYLSGLPALGHQITGKNASFEIVGVVRNSLCETFGERPQPVLYFSYRDRFRTDGQIHVRVRDAEASLAPELNRIVHEINPAITLFDVRTLTEHVDKNLFFRRIPARMFAVLGPLILVLAAIGIYAVVAYSVAQRTTEIGVRLALGAPPRRVVRQIVQESLHVVWAGLLPAWLLAVVVMLHLRGGVLNATILLGVPALLVGVATLAAWLPARRAATIDPVVALRTE